MDGDLELSVIATIYNAVFLVFSQDNIGNILLLNGDIDDLNKIFLNVCFVNGNHYNILYEIYKKDFKNNNNKYETNYNILDIEKITKKN